MSKPNFGGKTLVFCGTSRTVAVAGGLAGRWTKLFCDECNAVEDNRGISGSALIAGTSAFWDKVNIPAYIAAIHAGLNIEFGTNEALTFGGDAGKQAEFKTALTAFILFAVQSRGWPLVLLTVQNLFYPGAYYPGIPEAYSTVIDQVITATGTRRADYRSHFLAIPNVADLFSDGTHENATTGQRAVADFYETLSYPTTAPGFRLRRRYA